MLTYLIVAIFALLIGSFLNVVIYRLPRRESVAYPGSYCPSCGRNLKSEDLIPVISYLRLGGRCRFCRNWISVRYPLVEIITAVTFLMIYLKWGLTIRTGVGWIFTAILIITAFTDLDEGIIPNLITYPAIIIGLFLSPYTIGLKSSGQGVIAFAGIFLITSLLSRGGMGGGDIKLAGAIGAFDGFIGSMITLIISSLGGGLWAALLLWQGKADRKTTIRFGPFLAGSAWLVWMYGTEIINLYLKIILKTS